MEMRQMTKIILAHELLEQGISKTRIAERLQVSRRTLTRWAQSIERYGDLETYLEYYQPAKKGSRRKRKSDAMLKRRIWALREKYHQCCGQKIQYFIQKEYQMEVSITTIYKILSEKYKLRSRWQNNHKRGPIPAAKAARQVVQMDTVVFGEVFAFTAIDIFSKESAVLLRPALEAADGQAFLHKCMLGHFDGHVEIIQTDGGTEFKGLFSQDVLLYCDRHRVAQPY
jgi:transposase